MRYQHRVKQHKRISPTVEEQWIFQPKPPSQGSSFQFPYPADMDVCAMSSRRIRCMHCSPTVSFSAQLLQLKYDYRYLSLPIRSISITLPTLILTISDSCYLSMYSDNSKASPVPFKIRH